ncbi:MAG: dipeptide/tripeptide permease, partial [Coxiellaceae bacterium]|nr:dipeptide/tripeptide permease [Coxiellaceae bacterium]
LAAYFSRDTGIVSPWWVVTSYWFQSTGELLVSALGLSLASRFVPQRFMGYSMGLWFLSMSLASLIAGHLASLASIPQNVSHDPKVSLPIYSNLFLHIGIVTVVFAVVMFCLIPLIKRLIVKPATR